jgi:hypothetical protein
MVASCPFAAAFTSAQNSATAAGISRRVRTFRHGLSTAGKNSSIKATNSALSTHESGSPADAVKRAIQFSKFFC